MALGYIFTHLIEFCNVHQNHMAKVVQLLYFEVLENYSELYMRQEFDNFSIFLASKSVSSVYKFPAIFCEC
jgi:hypothetical protein